MKPITFQVPFGTSHFIPAGCIHFPLGEKDILHDWVRAVKESENGFTLLLGDSLDAARTHYRDFIRGYRADSNSQLTLDKHIREDVEKLAEVLTPISNKIMGAILGNHFWEFSDGTNSEQYLCQLLEIPYLGPMGVIRVEFRDGEKLRDKLIVFGHHHGGSRGGRTTGADVGALERAELSFDADIYALSHTHRRFGFKLPKMGVSNIGSPKIVEQTKTFIRSGAMLKGFGEDNPTVDKPHFPAYAETNAYRPTDLGYVTLKIEQTRGSDKEDIRRKFTLSY